VKQYYDKETTPLKYHTFMRYVGLPLSILTSISNIVTSWPGPGEFHAFYLIDFGAFFISLALSIAAFVGFFKWAGYAWNCFMLNYLVNGLYRLIIVGLYAVYLPDQLASSVGSLLGFLIVAVLVVIYYWKRRPLFFQNQSSDSYATAVEPSWENTNPIQYCHNCGFKLHPGSEYCSGCGTPIPKKP